MSQNLNLERFGLIMSLIRLYHSMLKDLQTTAMIPDAQIDKNFNLIYVVFDEHSFSSVFALVQAKRS